MNLISRILKNNMICPNCKKEMIKEKVNGQELYKFFIVGDNQDKYCSLCIDDREKVKKEENKTK